MGYGEGKEMLTNSKTKDKFQLVLSGNKGRRVVAKKVSKWYKQKWTWNGIMPLCLDDNTCRKIFPDKFLFYFMHGGYLFSENRSGKIVTQFMYKGEMYEHSQRTDSEGTIIYATPGVAMDFPIRGPADMNNYNAKPHRKETLPRGYRVLFFSEKNGFQDVKDFDPSLARATRMDDDRHVVTTAICARIRIPHNA